MTTTEDNQLLLSGQRKQVVNWRYRNCKPTSLIQKYYIMYKLEKAVRKTRRNIENDDPSDRIIYRC